MTRKLVALSERKPKDAQFRYVMQTLDGAPCCASNDPEFMCDECAAAASDNQVPPPPSLADKIRQARSMETRFANAKTGIHHPETLETLKAALRPEPVE